MALPYALTYYTVAVCKSQKLRDATMLEARVISQLPDARTAHRRTRKASRLFVPLLLAMLAAVPAMGRKAQAPTSPEDLQIVDCLLPPVLHQLGPRATFLKPRRPIRTTALDCRIRGGQYQAYDRASYATALQVWLESAKAGDPEAQNYVGEIFAKGLGTDPDYGAAAIWYRKAAEQGYTRAQVNLGFLYEKGLGVSRDPQVALSWYRKAAGLPQAIALDDSPTGAARVQELEEEVDRLRRQAGELRRQLEELQDALDAAPSGGAVHDALASRLAELREHLDGTSSAHDQARARLAASRPTSSREQVQLGGEFAGPAIELIDPPLVAQRSSRPRVLTRPGIHQRELIGRVTAAAGLLRLLVNDRPVTPAENGLFQALVPVGETGSRATLSAIDRQGKRVVVELDLVPENAPAPPPAAPGAGVPKLDYGDFHALIVGNNAYRNLQSLDTAENDAREFAELLESKYGFKTRLLLNADRYQLLSALSGLRAELDEKDNFLLYYAGHGWLDHKIQRGYWLPIGAEQENSANWISTFDITDHLSLLPARHVLVIADSCYSGALTRSSLARLEAGMTPEARVHWLEKILGKRSRTALTSGGLQPVPDGGGGGHSAFAKALLDVLGDNLEVIEAQRVYREVAARVAFAAQAMELEQVPEYAPIRYSGHEAGEFLFVPAVD